MRWKWPYITRSGDSRNRNQPTDFAEEAKLVPSWGALERAERVQHIRIVRFWRSTKLVEMCFGSGLPVTAIERHPMSMRRFTRLTNGFSKKVENLGYSVALHLYVVQLC